MNIWVKIIAPAKKPAFVLHVCMSYSLTIFLLFFSLVEDLTQFLAAAAAAVAMVDLVVCGCCLLQFHICNRSQINEFISAMIFLFLYCICFLSYYTRCAILGRCVAILYCSMQSGIFLHCLSFQVNFKKLFLQQSTRSIMECMHKSTL